MKNLLTGSVKWKKNKINKHDLMPCLYAVLCKITFESNILQPQIIFIKKKTKCVA